MAIFRNKQITHIVAGLVTAVVLSLVAPAAYAVSAGESFADGNRLFRDDLYWAALLRYRQAAEAGMDTPLLHYNVGVAHYKARQYGRAHQALLKASRTPRLRVISHYNMGINAYAAGTNEEALRWLRRARDQEQSPKIRRLAIRAIARIRRKEPRDEPIVVQAGEVLQAKKFTDLEVYARVGFGINNNIYRTPGDSYIDLSNRNQAVLVDPVLQEGTYYPVRLGAKYTINSFEHESFFGRYRMTGRFHTDELLTNADEYIQEIAFGSEYVKKKENRESIVFSAFTIAQHNELYFDPDDGTERTSNGTNIGDRLSYVRVGPEIRMRQSWERFSFNFRGKAQLWNYERTQIVPEYDHEYFRIGTDIQYRFTYTSLLRLSAQGYRRNYTDRPAYELDGTQPLGNPTVEYLYYDYGLTARQRISPALWFGINYVHTERADEYLGYNDYSRDSYGMEFKMRLGRRLRLSADATYRVYNYTNAFAYNNPAAGRKLLETLTGTVSASFKVRSNITILGEFAYRETASNDLRIDYDQSQFLLSLQWNYD